MTREAVIVTGAAGGIGAALCERMRADGYLAIGVDRFESTASDLSFRLDISDSVALQDLGRQLAAEHPIKAIIHNAAVQPLGGAGETPLETWFDALRVNVVAADILIGATQERLIASGGADIVIGSVHGRATTGGITAYATTKAALEGWVRSAALDVGPGIRVNGIAPGAINTAKLREGFARWGDAEAEERKAILRQRTALGRIGEPEEVAAAASFLIGDDSRFITGTMLLVDGGASARLGSE